MSQHDHPLWQLLDKLQMDVRDLDKRIVEIRMHVSNLNLPDPSESVCPSCGAKHKHRHAMEEHLYHVHDGPVPAHYLAAERLAGLEAA